MSFNIGALGSGLKKGIEYDLQFKRNLVWALKTKNTAALTALEKIAEQNIKEIAGTAVHVTDQMITALLFGNDPTAKSREMMHQFSRDFGDH